jgi:hypothetical protein
MIGCNDVNLKNMTMLNMFLFFFPSQFLHDVLLLQLNKSLQEQKEHACGIGEFIRFIGLWFYMATFKGFNQSEYWSLKQIDDFNGVPIRLNNWMSKRRFDTILSNLHYTDKECPTTFQDQFHNVRQLIQAWNKNMTEKFLPSWVSCLDESMSSWISRWTCPGWSSALKNLILLAMNIIPFVVVIVASCTKSNWLKVKIMLQHQILTYIPTKEEQSVFYYDSAQVLPAEEW